MNSLKSILIFIVMLFASTAWAIAPQAQLNILKDVNILKEGDIVEGLLKIWPLENADLEEFKKLQNTTLANTYFVSEVEKSSVSDNNADVVEVKMILIIKQSKSNLASVLSYKNSAIPLQAPEIKIDPHGTMAKDYFIADQSVSGTYFRIIMILVSIMCGILIVYIFRDKIKTLMNKFQKNPKEILKEKYKRLFLAAKTREDYELLYAEKGQWVELLSQQTSACREFFSAMENHQYKKNWSVEDLKEIETLFDYLRGTFK